jgi:hypothetical protein
VHHFLTLSSRIPIAINLLANSNFEKSIVTVIDAYSVFLVISLFASSIFEAKYPSVTTMSSRDSILGSSS